MKAYHERFIAALCVALAKRYTFPAKKKFFLNRVKPFFSKLGYKVTLRENKQKLIRLSLSHVIFIKHVMSSYVRTIHLQIITAIYYTIPLIYQKTCIRKELSCF
jgi:uncharacterized membrane protein YagU involved in acid resistance